MQYRAALLAASSALLLGVSGGAAQVLAVSQGVGGGSEVKAERARTVLRGARLEGAAPMIDGRTEEAAWAAAEAATDFVQMRPDPGQQASERTEARVLYDATTLYVAMRMYDTAPDSIAAQLARRDAGGIYSDWAHLLIDSYNDRRTAFRFSVNPRGVQKDVLHFDDSSEDVSWNAVWTVATSRDSLGWTAEFRIPLSQLRFSGDPGEERVWGINFGREIARRGEWSWWSPVLPSAGGMVSQAGELRGLTGLTAGRRLELLPYSVGRVTRAPGDAANPFYRASAGDIAAGADLKYGLTSDLTLTATINPDFGQVEADPSVVNLSAFESYFGERRPFFLEGANIFSFGVGTDDGSGESLFYSRRIGRAPQRRASSPGGWVHAPDATTILGAAKLSGKTASGWTVGVLNAVTAEERAQIAAPGAPMREEPVEPMTNYAVLSLARDFRRGRSTLGMMGTSTHRRLGEGTDLDFLRSAAYSGGINARHRFAGDTWEASGYLAGSHILGSPAAIARVQRSAGHYFQRPDAEHLAYDPDRTSLTGLVGNFWVGKFSGGSVRGGVGGHLRTPGLELNDLGFMAEADQLQLFGNLRYHRFRPQGPFRSWTLGVNPFSMWTLGGERTYTQLGHWGNVELKNFWNGGWWVGKRFEALSTTTLRGGPAVVRPGGLRYSTWWNSDRRKPLSGSVNLWGGYEDEGGSHDYGVGTGLTFRPSSQLNVSLSPSYRRSLNSWQYVAQPAAGGSPTYVLAHLDQTTLSLTTRLNYTIRPALSLELYGQPFVSAGDYEEYREVRDPRAATFAARFRDFSRSELSYDPTRRRYHVDRDGDGKPDLAFGDPDFNFKQLRGNAVLRWEYRPGSTLFVVWSQGRTDYTADGSFDAGRDFGRLLGLDPDHRVPGTSVLLVKLNYWLNL